MILPSSKTGIYGSRKVDGNICIGDTSLSKYMPKYIKPMININNITWGCKTCISSMLLKLNINKLIISKWAKLDKLYINYTSARLLEIFKNKFIAY